MVSSKQVPFGEQMASFFTAGFFETGFFASGFFETGMDSSKSDGSGKQHPGFSSEAEDICFSPVVALPHDTSGAA